jgi:single-strand DNA-binding protein
MGTSVNGTIVRILDTRKVSEKFSVREFDVSTTGDKYPQVLRLQATNDRIAQLDGLHAGDEVNVELNLRGREWKGNDGTVKVFNTLDAWRINATGKRSEAPSSSGNDGLPF